MMPLKTAVNLFEKEYKKDIKNFFDRKYQRLREVYFSLFACRALDLMEEKVHFPMYYEQQDRNDVSFIVPNSDWEVWDIRYFDVKEYVPQDKQNFNDYLDSIVKKSLIKDYELILWVQKDIEISELMKIDWSKVGKHVFMINGCHDKNMWFQNSVMYIQDGSILFNQIVDVSDLIDTEAPLMIYQDKINFKSQ